MPTSKGVTLHSKPTYYIKRPNGPDPMMGFTELLMEKPRRLKGRNRKRAIFLKSGIKTAVHYKRRAASKAANKARAKQRLLA